MQKLVLVAFAFLSFGTVNSQDKLIKVSPFHFFDGTFNMSLEKSCDADYTVNLSGGIHLIEDGWNYDSNEKGLTAEVQIRKYVLNFNNSDLKFNGVYVAPFAKLSYFHLEDTYTEWNYEYDDEGDYVSESRDEVSRESSSKSGQAGVVMGVQYVMSEVILFDFFLGGGVQYAVTAGDDMSNYRSGVRFHTGVMPKIGFNFGVKL